MSLGAVTGVIVDANEAGVDVGFVEEVSEALKPASVAVLAEIDEIWIAPPDTRMQTLIGMLIRRLRAGLLTITSRVRRKNSTASTTSSTLATP